MTVQFYESNDASVCGVEKKQGHDDDTSEQEKLHQHLS